MPINEASRKPPREKWPLAFDIEGVPRDTATRQRLMEEIRLAEADPNPEKRNPMAQFRNSAEAIHGVTNSFAVDQPKFAAEPFIEDINNPPKRPYKHQEYPKTMYHHESGRVITIPAGEDAPKLEAAAKKKGFKNEPSPSHDYSHIRGGVASGQYNAPPNRELTAEQIAEMEDEDQE
jgi:hypothetical protein